jgi:UDP-N-acetyl-D-galactosamine dehydrogenase
VHDPLADAQHALNEYGVSFTDFSEFYDLDALVLAVPHQFYVERVLDDITQILKPNGVLADIKSVYRPEQMPAGMRYWSL